MKNVMLTSEVKNTSARRKVDALPLRQLGEMCQGIFQGEPVAVLSCASYHGHSRHSPPCHPNRPSTSPPWICYSHFYHWLLVEGSNIQPNIHTYEGWNFNSGNYLFTTDTK